MKSRLIYTATAVAVTAAVTAAVYGYAESNDEAYLPETATEPHIILAALETERFDSDEKIEEPVDYGKNENISGYDERRMSLEENDPAEPKKTAENGSDIFSAVDPVDDRISYNVTIDEEKIFYEKKCDLDYKYETEDSAAASEYLKDFFGTDSFPVAETYRDNLVRYVYNGIFACEVPVDTIAVSPVEGTVIASGYTGALGKYVVLEFDSDKVIVMFHFDEVCVKNGDKITADYTLGICGTTGQVEVGKPRLSMIAMKKK